MTVEPDLFLRRHPYFGRLADDELRHVARAMTPRRFARDQTLFSRGDAANGLYLVTEGLVRLSIVSADGRELTVRLAGPGEVIGEIAAIDGGLRTTDALAVMGTRSLVLTHDDFMRFVDTMQPLRWAVLHQLCARLRATTDQLESFALSPLEGRLARLFLALASQPDARRDGDEATFVLNISQREIASLVGASRPRVNQLLVSWQESGRVTRSGAMVRCRMSALDALVAREAK